MKKVVYLCFMALLIIGCNSGAKQEEAVFQAKQAVLDSIVRADNDKKIEDIKKHITDSINLATAAKHQQEKVVIYKNADGGTSATTNNNTTTTEPTPKKGWSSKAKGAVIGAGVGAITGAMIDKKKGEGAVVGGLLGAGAGLGVGAIIDGKKKKQPKQ